MKSYTSLKKALAEPDKVVKLSLRGSRISELPPAIDHLPHLRVLDLSQTPLKTLPRQIRDLANLEVLVLSEASSLASLPDEIGELQHLETLDVWGTALSTLPATLFKLPHLQVLNLGATRALTVLPHGFANLTHLHSLNLYGKSARQVPLEIFSLPSLRQLEWGDSPLTELPDAITGLKRLRTLSLAGSDIRLLPPSLGLLETLTTISLSLCSVLDLGSAFQVLAHLPRLGGLALAGSHPWGRWFKNIPEGLGQLKTLKRLDLHGNQLTHLPTDLFVLKQLEELNLAQNVIETLPKEISNLQRLRRLNLQFNRYNPYIENSTNINLVHLFTQASKLKHLRELDLRYTNLASLPEEVAEFPMLKVLYLGNEFPASERERVQQLLPRVNIKF